MSRAPGWQDVICIVEDVKDKVGLLRRLLTTICLNILNLCVDWSPEATVPGIEAACAGSGTAAYARCLKQVAEELGMPMRDACKL